jgi:hypothetical protein
VARTESVAVRLRCRPKSAPMPERPKTLSARIRKPNRFSQACLRLKWINSLERTRPLDLPSTPGIGIEGKRKQPNDAQVGYAPGLFGAITVSTSVPNQTGEWAERVPSSSHSENQEDELGNFV